MIARKRFKKVYIEISNICNLQCGFLPRGRAPENVMGRTLFAKIAGEVAPLTEEVCLHLMASRCPIPSSMTSSASARPAAAGQYHDQRDAA